MSGKQPAVGVGAARTHTSTKREIIIVSK